MKLNEKLAMDKHLSNALDLIDKAADELNLSQTDKEAVFIRAQLVEYLTTLTELRYKIYRFKELAKELYNEL